MSGQTIIGVTGGIGAGKSTVAAMLGECGAFVLSADEIARSALDIGTPCYKEVAAWLGEEILLPNGPINRRALAASVFEDEAKRERLNAIIHPYVLRVLRERTAAVSGTVVWDVPLLFESGFEKFADLSLLVTAPVEARLARLTLPREEALARMAAQWTDEKKAALADVVLLNEGTLAALRSAAEALYLGWETTN